MAGPDPLRYKIIIDDLAAQDFAPAEQAISSFTTEPPKSFPDGSSWDPIETLIEGWQEEVEYYEDEGYDSESAHKALIEALDPKDIETVRAVLRADLERLIGWLQRGDEGEFCGEFDMHGSLDRVGGGVVIWAEIDLRHSISDPAVQFGTLQRLIDSDVLADVPGLRAECS